MDKYLDKNKVMIEILLFPLLMVFVLNPVEIYYANMTDFIFSLDEFIYILIFAAEYVLAGISLIISLLPDKIFEKIVCFIFSGSFVFYIQNMFLNKKLSNSNGASMDWSEMKNYAIVNFIIYIALFVMILFFALFIQTKKNGIKYICNISLIFAFFQLVAIISCISQICNTRLNNDEYHINGTNQFKVAPNHNVIVLIIDSASARAFDSIIKDNPALADEFKDFTFYNNYESDFSGTFPQVLHMYTGYPIDVSYTRMENAANAWCSERSRNFYDKLHSKGYTNNIYVESWHYEFGEGKPMVGSIDNVDIARRTISNNMMIVMMLKYSLYRCVPYILKPRFEVIPEYYRDVAYYNDKIAYGNIDFYERLKSEKLDINSEWNNAFILEHIQGLHYPYCHNENVEYVEEETTYEDMYKGVIVILSEYLNQLKELGLYDSATIFIMADHGNQEEGAVYLLKNVNEKHDIIQINSSPIDAIDFQPTILSVIGEDYTEYGTSIFDWNEGDIRERVRSTITPDDYYFNMYGHTYIGDAMFIKNGTDYDLEFIGLQ